MFAARGLVFSHEAVREWEAKLAPALAGELRRRRRGEAGRSWHVDETYLKVGGRWCYLYRAIDRSGAVSLRGRFQLPTSPAATVEPSVMSVRRDMPRHNAGSGPVIPNPDDRSG